MLNIQISSGTVPGACIKYCINIHSKFNGIAWIHLTVPVFKATSLEILCTLNQGI